MVPITDSCRTWSHVRKVPIASFWTALRQVRSTLQRRHEATDGFNRIRKGRTFDPGCSSPWVSSAAASGASKPKWMTKCPWLAFAEGGGEAGVCDGDRAGASVIRSHHAVKHERCQQPLQFVVVLPPRMDTSFSRRNRRMSHAVSSKPSASFPS